MKTILKLLFISILFISYSCAEDGTDGIDGKDGIDGTDGIDGQDATGLTHVFFQGNITDAEAQNIIDTQIGSTTQFIIVRNTTQLTTLDLSKVTQLADLTVSDNETLTTLQLPNITTFHRGIWFQNNPLVQQLNFSSLTYANTIFIIGNIPTSNTSLQQLTFPVLEEAIDITIADTNTTNLEFPLLNSASKFAIYGNLNLNNLTINPISQFNDFSIGSSKITSINLSATTFKNSLYIVNNALLTSIELPLLEDVSELNISTNNSLASVNLPKLTTSEGSIDISGNSVLTNVNIPLINSFSFLSLHANALDSNFVNGFLNQLINTTPTITNTNVDLSNQTPTAPPTGQGIIDKQTLIDNGSTIYTD